MLIKLSDAIQRHSLNIKGIIHVGGHRGQEMPEYFANGIRNIILIEPCKPAFQYLRRHYSTKATLFNCALGAFNGTAVMNVETANTGQSNSLLKPAKHLQQYPSIQFTQTEMVQVKTMDSLPIKRDNYNMLNIDVQGFELEVLKGATETLKHIDVIYTEVNRDEVYENCARVEQLDEYLTDFERVETDWGGGTWGDAIYLRKQAAKEPINTIGMVNVPKQFRPHIRFPYPLDNDLIFEEWFYQHYQPTYSERIYLPIFWTSYYVNNKYGKDRNSLDELQRFLNSLDKTVKYFTICQYDDGILNDIKHLDIKVFGMSGKPIDYPLPLLCKPHKFEYHLTRDVLANFVGAVTHPIRTKMLNTITGQAGFHVATKKQSLQDFCRILGRSVFTLCPRGYGQTSFRIVEAMQYGSIPVYISDDFLLPHNIPFYTYGVAIKEDELPYLVDRLRAISQEEIKHKQAAIKELYGKYFTYEGCREIILKEAQF